MRARLDEARSALGLPAASYTDPTLTAGVTTVKAVHIQELRQRVTEALGSMMSMIPDGLTSLTYNAANNHISTSGWNYDAAGNQIRVSKGSGVWQRFQYDAANRLVKVKDDSLNDLATFTYGDDRDRLISDEAGVKTYYALEGGSVLAEYTESGGATTPAWSKSYVFLGGRLLSTVTPNGAGEAIQYHHPDKLGTRLVTNGQDTTYFEQMTLPFGTALTAESTGSTNRRFTSYDRSSTTGLDYAANRTYDSLQGRFTQVDPIGMKSVDLKNPQTLNLYAYCTNDTVNQLDPDGLGFFSFLKKLFIGIGRVVSAVGKAISSVLNNKWVRIAVFIAGFILPGLGGLLYTVVDTALKIYNRVADFAAQLQLLGSLLQGKFKEFGISIAMGIIGGAIAQVEDAIITGVQDALFKGKYGGNILAGAWHGLGEGLSKLGRTLRHAFDKFPRNLIPFYGFFCSPANVDKLGTAPVDPADDICRQHDDEYQRRGKGWSKSKADREFLKSLFYLPNAFGHGFVPKIHLIDIAFGSRASVGSVYHFIAIPAFTGLVAYRGITGR
jgi:RHS repeat-associated protein